ncbi:MAG: hypothetical protein KDA27_26630 [Candidatus Eisenbacteria bacterium]|uniref:Uncharacterized protein n=1 Tax=Eiseniibacteriota bacterium TaxID=2212470 RepID=A0A956SIC6_UNCEI|nr:hypothetical protein [Candidatus Eisenbacteria bacterium]MCB9462397.1 hypothetical protein [Candidatus Eisenbacteria bacterium]
MSTLSLNTYPTRTHGTWIHPETPGDQAASTLGRLSAAQKERVERAVDRISRGETRGANFTWIDYSITIRWVGGRLVMSLFSHDQFGSVVGYMVEEILEEGDTRGFAFAGRRWGIAA